jgi:glycosyltransferase involved in cell wall biosynthesis
VNEAKEKVRVLFSFPHKLGGDRISLIAWQQVNGLIGAGAEVIVFSSSLNGPPPNSARVHTTLARGRVRLPYRLFGSMRTFAMHDYIVSRKIKDLSKEIDIVHTWPLGALRTLRICAKLDIPTVLERPNAYTPFALEVVRKECERLAITMPPGHEHAENPEKIRVEEEEYKEADRLLCPSDFVAGTFLDEGFPTEKLARHQYGFDETVFYPDPTPRDPDRGLTMLFAGGCAPRKGLHYALEAWLRSDAHRTGHFLVAGEFIPGYGEKLAQMLAHPSVRVLGHRKDVPELMRSSDIFVLPTIEEGSALVTSEARGSGCVLLVSEASGAVCKHMENALVHRVGDVDALTEHITTLNHDRRLLADLRSASLRTVDQVTWAAAGRRLLQVYRETISMYRDRSVCETA